MGSSMIMMTHHHHALTVFVCLGFISIASGALPSRCAAPTKRVEQMTIGINTVIPGYWIRLNDKQVCVLPRGNSPGILTNPYGGFIGAVKLVHLYGQVTCDNSQHDYYSNWGCSRTHPRHKMAPLNIHITDAKRNVMFSGRKDLHVDWYESELFEPDSEELVLSSMTQPKYLPRGKDMQVWYGEDYLDLDEQNNDGNTCFDLYAHFL